MSYALNNTSKMNELFDQYVSGEISLRDVRNDLHPVEFELFEEWITQIED